MTPFGTPPSSPGAPPAPSPAGGAPAGPPPGLSGLVGGVPQGQPQGPSPQQQIADYMDQVRNLSLLIDALAQDHPEAADDLNQAKNALVNSMSKVATSANSPETGMQPPTV